MRFIDRKSIQTPASLLDPTSKVARERQRAEQHYQKTPVPKKSFPFAAYKCKDIVAALTALFSGKCAYCESKAGATQPFDVEHYRPKGAVAEDPNHRGYWWLALDWENLLPSCSDCNRERYQYLIEVPASGPPFVASKTRLAGKESAFPIRGKVRANKPGDDLALEDPLLLDPTRHQPEDHLQWKIDYPESPVVVARSTGGEPSPHGTVSVKVYGLNRQKLVEERRDLLRTLQFEYELLRVIFGQVTMMPAGPLREASLRRAREMLDQFRQHGDPTKRYSAVAAVFVKQVDDLLREEFTEALASVTVASTGT